MLSFHSWAAIAYSSIKGSCNQDKHSTQVVFTLQMKITVTQLEVYVAYELPQRFWRTEKQPWNYYLYIFCLPWCSGTALDHQWTGTHTGPFVGTLWEDFWSIPGTGCCCWVETLQLAPVPGSTGTEAQGSKGTEGDRNKYWPALVWSKNHCTWLHTCVCSCLHSQ